MNLVGVEKNLEGVSASNFITKTTVGSVLLKEGDHATHAFIKVAWKVDNAAMMSFFKDQGLSKDNSFSIGGLDVDMTRTEGAVASSVQEQ